MAIQHHAGSADKGGSALAAPGDDCLATRQTAIPPVVVMSGQTSVGKSAITRALVSATDLVPVPNTNQSAPAAASPVVASAIDELDPDGLCVADRRAGLNLLATVLEAANPSVVESSALPMLLPVHNTALIVRLYATLPVRPERRRPTPCRYPQAMRCPRSA